MARPDEALIEQRAAQEVYSTRTAVQGGRRVMVNAGGTMIDATEYVGMKHPGFDATAAFGNPESMLKKDRVKNGYTYCWREPHDRFTKFMCKKGTLVPVLIDDIDPESDIAAVDSVRLITKDGPRELVMLLGLGLFAMRGDEAQRSFQAWEQWYLAQLAEEQGRWQQQVEDLSNTSDGRATGEFTITDIRREQI